MSDVLEQGPIDSRDRVDRGRFFVSEEMLPGVEAQTAVTSLTAYTRTLRTYQSISADDVRAAYYAVDDRQAGYEDAQCFLDHVHQLQAQLDESDLAESIVMQTGEDMAAAVLARMQGHFALIGEGIYYRDHLWLTCYDEDAKVVYFNRPDLTDEVGSREAEATDYMALIGDIELHFAKQQKMRNV